MIAFSVEPSVIATDDDGEVYILRRIIIRYSASIHGNNDIRRRCVIRIGVNIVVQGNRQVLFVNGQLFLYPSGALKVLAFKKLTEYIDKSVLT